MEADNQLIRLMKGTHQKQPCLPNGSRMGCFRYKFFQMDSRMLCKCCANSSLLGIGLGSVASMLLRDVLLPSRWQPADLKLGQLGLCNGHPVVALDGTGWHWDGTGWHWVHWISHSNESHGQKAQKAQKAQTLFQTARKNARLHCHALLV